MSKLLLKMFVKDYENIKDFQVRQKYGFLSSIVGIIVNILLFSLKCIAGLITGAISIFADAFNNLSDAGSSIVNLIGFKIALSPPDEEHPFGHGRAEYIAGLMISFIITIMGFELGKNSFERIFSSESINFDIVPTVILLASVLTKLWLFFFNKKLGCLINSVSMKATATDSLSDVIATLAVLFGMLFYVFTGISIDGYIGLLVAGFILFSGVKTAKESLSPLLGQIPDDELVKDIEQTVCGYNEVLGLHDLIIHNYGVGVSMITLHAEIPASMDFLEAHELIDIIEDDLKIKYNCSATIHMDPVVTDDEEANCIKAEIKRIAKEISPALSIHDFRMTRGIHQCNLIFDVVVPFKFEYSEKRLREEFETRIRQTDEKFCLVINFDRKLTNLD